MAATESAPPAIALTRDLLPIGVGFERDASLAHTFETRSGGIFHLLPSGPLYSRGRYGVTFLGLQ